MLIDSIITLSVNCGHTEHRKTLSSFLFIAPTWNLLYFVFKCFTHNRVLVWNGQQITSDCEKKMEVHWVGVSLQSTTFMWVCSCMILFSKLLDVTGMCWLESQPALLFIPCFRGENLWMEAPQSMPFHGNQTPFSQRSHPRTREAKTWN